MVEVVAAVAVADSRFWANTKEGANGCIEWQGYRDRQGYGKVMRVAVTKMPLLAHRYAWMLTHSEVLLPGAVVRHSCDNPPCVNPAHLQLGTQADNIDDRQRRGRHRPGRLLGEAHPQARLNNILVLSMRELYGDGCPIKELMEEYHVSHKTVWEIVTRRSWTHLPAEMTVRDALESA